MPKNESNSKLFYVRTQDHFGKEDEFAMAASVCLYDTESNQMIAQGQTGYDQYSQFISSFSTHQPYFSTDEKFVFLHMTKLGSPISSVERTENWVMIFKIDLTNELPFRRLQKIDVKFIPEENLSDVKNQRITYEMREKKIIFNIEADNKIAINRI